MHENPVQTIGNLSFSMGFGVNTFDRVCPFFLQITVNFDEKIELSFC